MPKYSYGNFCHTLFMTCKSYTAGFLPGQATPSGQQHEIRSLTCFGGAQRCQKHVYGQRLVPCHVLEYYLQAETAELMKW